MRATHFPVENIPPVFFIELQRLLLGLIIVVMLSGSLAGDSKSAPALILRTSFHNGIVLIIKWQSYELIFSSHIFYRHPLCRISERNMKLHAVHLRYSPSVQGFRKTASVRHQAPRQIPCHSTEKAF